MRLPTISIVMPTLNSEKKLENCLISIRNQEYDQNDVEILVIDGGSTDKTSEIAKKYGCVFIDGAYRDNQEARRGVGLSLAKNELYAAIDSDNSLPHSKWLCNMVTPFMKGEDIFFSQVWRYGIKEDFGLVNKYFALFGVNDPVALYLKKNEKIPWTQDIWETGEIIKDTSNYTVVRFNEHNLPTVGCNGFFALRDVLLKAQCAPTDFFHIDVVLDVVKLGYTNFAMVKDEIYHDTATTLIALTKKRMKYFIDLNQVSSNRRYFLFSMKNKKDLTNLSLFCIYTLTLMQPFIFSIRGFIKKPYVAWFLHPIVCLIFLFSYAMAFLKLTFIDIVLGYFKRVIRNRVTALR